MIRFLSLGIYFFSALLSFESFGQSLLFKELFRKSEKAQYDFGYGQSASEWQSPYGRETRMKATASSASIVKENSRIKLLAHYENIQFERPLASGEFLENPSFSSLWDLEGTERRYMTEVSVLSPSDQPFKSVDEISANITWVSAPKTGLIERGSRHWLWFVNYSSTRSFLPNIPLPGFTYLINTEKGWNWSLGVPFISASYFNPNTWSSRITLGPFTYSAELSYGPPYFKTSVFSTWRQESFFISERADRKERLYLDQKDIGVSLKHPLTKEIMMDWSVKYAFDKKHIFGESYSKETRPEQKTGSSVDWLAQLIFTP